MLPRGTLAISWSDLAAAATYCATPGDGEASARRIEAAWGPNSVVCLSVRTGLDAILSELAYPPGSEILISAITIPHILEILAEHKLVPVPLDLDLDQLRVDAAAVRAAVTERTKAILVAHLFGSRMPLDEIEHIARERGLALIEDCAQANDGSGYRGHPGSTVSLFSFGVIKRQTALGGAILRFGDANLAGRVRARLASYPWQPRSAYVRRLLLMAAAKALGSRYLFPVFVAFCRLTGQNHDRVIASALRGFKGAGLFVRLRRRPPGPMMRLLERRLRDSGSDQVAACVRIVEAVTAADPDLPRPGAHAGRHSHWLFPVLSANPDDLARTLWSKGFDATRGASNLTFVPQVPGRPRPVHAEQLMREVLYLPLAPWAADAELKRLGQTMRDLARK